MSPRFQLKASLPLVAAASKENQRRLFSVFIPSTVQLTGGGVS